MMNPLNVLALTRRQCMGLLAAGSVTAPLRWTWGQFTGKQPKRIYIAADDHTDYMWTADEATYRRAFIETLDHYLDLADQTDDRAPAYQSRWNCDGLLWFREYETNRNPSQVERLVQRIKSGHISIPITMLVSCYGGTPTEAVIRGLYYGGQVQRRYDLKLSIAVAMENQTLPYGLGMLWAGSGVRYSWKGICGCATKMESPGKREHDVYWWIGPDGSRILMKWYSLAPKLSNRLHANEGPGGYAEARDPALAIEFVDNDVEFQKRNPHSVIGLFGQGWDDLKTSVPLDDPDRSFPEVAMRLSNDDRRVIVSNEYDYFRDMEDSHGDQLPEVAHAYGNEWELYNASLAEVSSAVKRATEKLRAAEAMASMVALTRPRFADHLQKMRDQAWIAFGLYWEHDWTADGPISRDRRAAWQRKICKQITDYVEALHDSAAKNLGEIIDWSDLAAVYVFNPLGWTRSDYADIPIDDDGESLDVIDLDTLRVLASQPIERDGRNYLRIFASDVPACGYRRYRIRERNTRRAPPIIHVSDDVVVSSKHRLKINPDGSISDWTWMEARKSLLGEKQFANFFGDSTGNIVIESSGPVSTTIRIDIAGPPRRFTRITLFESLDRIEIENVIAQNFRNLRSWRFEFNLENPQTYHEEVGAIIRAATASEGGDYADLNARTDWLTMNHFAAMGDDDTIVTISNWDCLFFHLGENTKAAMDSDSNQIHVLAGGQVDGPKLGIASQGGDSRFVQRFAVQCHARDAHHDRNRSMRFALEHQNPLVVGQITARSGSSAASHSLLQLESDNVVLWAAKPSEDGIEKGLIVRLWNTSSNPSDYRLLTEFSIARCTRSTHVETDLGPMNVIGRSVGETLAAGEMRTLRIIRSTG